MPNDIFDFSVGIFLRGHGILAELLNKAEAHAAERKVELVLPPGVPPSHGLRFLATKQGWIAARLAALPQPVRFAEGVIVPVLGIPHRILREDDPTAPPVAIRDEEIRVRGDPVHIERRVRDHLVAVARTEFAARARPLAARIGRKLGTGDRAQMVALAMRAGVIR